MATTTVQVFSPSDLKKFNDLLQSCSDTQCVLDKLSAMGIDVSGLADANSGHQTFASKGKQGFFPDQP